MPCITPGSCPSFVHQCCNPIIEGYQVGQAQFALGEAMLAIPNHLLVIHAPYHCFQEDLLHDFARHRGEDDWPVVPGVFLFPLFKNGGDVAPSPASGDLPKLSRPLKYDAEWCPAFGQDRVNFHQNPGRDTAGRMGADPTWPNRARYSIPCAVTLGSSGGQLGGGNSLAARKRGHRSGPAEQLCGSCGLCRVFSLSVSLLFLFPLFAVLLNCPYPDPLVSACFFPFSLHPGGGRGGHMALLLLAAAKP